MSLTPDEDRLVAILAAWVLQSSQATTVGEALRLLYTRERLPDDVRSAWTRLHHFPLRELLDPEAGLTISEALAGLEFAFKDERDAFVFRARISLDAPTLDEIALHLGVTRERVRQIQARAERGVAEALVGPRCSALRWRIWNFGERAGRVIPPGALFYRAAHEELVREVLPDCHSWLEDLALWSAGPYRRDSLGWLSCGETIDVSDILRHAVEANGRVDVGLLRRNLRDIGVSSDASDLWIERFTPIKEFAGGTYRWGGSVADKAATVLAAYGEPLGVEEIVDQIGEGHDPRSTRARLIGDHRFLRVGIRQIGLRGWDVDEFTGIVDEITAELERQGGSGQIREIAEVVAETHGVAPGSVTSMMTAPRFVVLDGHVRFRRPDEPYSVDRAPTDERGCYLIEEDKCVWRVLIDDQLLRGSGRRMPVGLGAWLGVLPGGRLDYDLPQGGRVQVSWPDSAIQGPSLGSLREPAQRLGGGDGDYLLVRFDRGRRSAEVALVRADDAQQLDPTARLSTLTGIDASAPDFMDRLAVAVGATQRSELRERLRRRNEEVLIKLLPAYDEPGELDHALQQLRHLF